MKNFLLFSSVALCLSLGIGSPLLAAEAVAGTTAVNTTAVTSDAPAIKPAETCLSDLRAFNTKMDKGGYWLGGSEYGYGYPAGGWGNGYGYAMGEYRPAMGVGYQNARPGYEIRVLVSAANILARQGKEQPCQAVLATTNAIYNKYAADMRDGKSAMVDGPGWRQQQIAAAQPVADRTMSLRSDELIGTEVRNQKDESLGSVDDLVMSPTSGKIAYLIVARGGLFGIDQKYVPVPWTDIKATPNTNLLVLDTSKSVMEGAPKVKHDQFFTNAQYTETSQKVDNYWKTHLAAN
ncbi:PRC-barrel domain-containing protein [Lichenihabitans psoromatis]|uniref:PRC-barrel domain-containing protein n=1 Tax=Lichenihabitans psoromatis TaxID=2528642 RepID=UPI00103615BE|nr:PRC-barrel domain-containing protein [Lichenihabitans psoromatis]